MSELVASQSVSIFNADNMTALMNFADIMAQGQVSTPDHLRGKPSDCLAVAMQAMQWNMNPFAVAQKTYLIKGKLGYESQLINAVISSSNAITGRFKYEQIGDWSKWRLGNKNTEYGLGVKVGAVLAGDDFVTWGETVYIATVTIRNSPLWSTNPYQQLCYLAMKYWSRLYTPDVILGVYDKEELQKVEKDITPPAPRASNLNALFNEQECEQLSKFDEMMALCDSAKTRSDYLKVMQSIKECSSEFSSEELDAFRKKAEELKARL